jgi:rubredoxin
MTQKHRECPECGEWMEYWSYVEGMQLACWECPSCGALADVFEEERAVICLPDESVK